MARTRPVVRGYHGSDAFGVSIPSDAHAKLAGHKPGTPRLAPAQAGGDPRSLLWFRSGNRV